MPIDILIKANSGLCCAVPKNESKAQILRILRDGWKSATCDGHRNIARCKISMVTAHRNDKLVSLPLRRKLSASRLQDWTTQLAEDSASMLQGDLELRPKGRRATQKKKKFNFRTMKVPLCVFFYFRK
jgi:hypothetical protein